ncbi:M23 family metallopeptidase [Clostridiaceae bacterium M8S5]|nr:M23 family metallopeptidase [Clostridiaceae bacterium M8S5]
MRNRESKFSKVINKMKNRISKESFYFVLFVCICIVAITSVFVSRQNIKRYKSLEYKSQVKTDGLTSEVRNIFSDNSNPRKDKAKDEPITSVIDTKEDEVIKAEESNESLDKNKDEDSNPKIKDKQQQGDIATNETKKQNEILKTIALPVVGQITKKFEIEKLVYSKTLEQWCTHSGIDIQARHGNVVKAVLDGKVIEIKTTQELGKTITLDHGYGIITKYACLSTDKMVKEGQKVKKGDPISGVGKGVGFELVQGPHLHFELLINGMHVDPQKYLPEIMNKEQ